MNYKTADLFDEYGTELRVVDPGFVSFGGRAEAHGAIVTLKAYEDNSLVRSMLEQPGEQRILVVDGGGSMRCAMLGDRLAALAVENSWAGVIINGCLRDSAELAEMDLGIWALATHPAKTEKRNSGQTDVVVHFGGVSFAPGEFVYADHDGIVVSERILHP